MNFLAYSRVPSKSSANLVQPLGQLKPTYINIYIQTKSAGPNWLIFFEGTNRSSGGNIGREKFDFKNSTGNAEQFN